MIEQTHLEKGSYERFLASIDVERMHDAQRHFWRLPLPDLSSSEIERNLFESLGGQNNVRPVLPHRIELLPAGTRIFRGRTVDKANTDEQQLTFCSTSSQYLAAPPTNSREGRFNSDGESVFYGSVSPFPIVDELSLNVGDRLVIGAFQANHDLKLIQLVPNFIFDDLDSNLRLIAKLQLAFIERLVTVPHGKSSRHAYRLAHYLTRSYFSLPHFEADGWMFPSAFDFSQTNVAFAGERAGEELQLTHSGLFGLEVAELRLRSLVPHALFQYGSGDASGNQVLPEEAASAELTAVFGGRVYPINNSNSNDGD